MKPVTGPGLVSDDSDISVAFPSDDAWLKDESRWKEACLELVVSLGRGFSGEASSAERSRLLSRTRGLKLDFWGICHPERSAGSVSSLYTGVSIRRTVTG